LQSRGHLALIPRFEADSEDIDFVIITPTRLLPVEVKALLTLGKRDLRGMKRFLEEHPDGAPFGVAASLRSTIPVDTAPTATC